MPLGFQKFSVSLVQLQKQINLSCFVEPSNTGGRLPISRVTQSLSALKDWLAKAPHHLRWDSAVSPQHLRSIAVLHLRYWSSVISVSRPFLLLSITESGQLESRARIECYDKLSGACIEAAEMCVHILQRMQKEDILSSLTMNDSHCAGIVMWILLLALRKVRSAKHQDMLRPDIEARVYESGVLDVEPQQEEPSRLSDGPGGSEIAEFDFDVSQWDVFGTLGLDSGIELMSAFPDALSAAGIQQLF